MGKNNEDLRKESLLDFVNKQKIAIQEKEKLDRIQEQKEYAAKIRQARITKDISETQRKGEESRKLVHDYKSGKGQQSSNKSQEFGTFYSWIMNSVPEFEAIIKAICYPVHAKRKQYLGAPMTALVGKGIDAIYYNATNYFNSNDSLPLPDVKYFTEVDDTGRLTLELMQDSFGSLLKNPDGSYNQDLATTAQGIFQAYVQEWLNSFDGLNEDLGYFTAEFGSPKEIRVYRKKDGNKLSTSDNYQVKTDCQDNYLKVDEYEDLLQGLGNQEKSLSVFLQNKCPGLNIEDSNTLRPKT